MDKISIIHKEEDYADDCVISGHKYLYETEAEYRAYVNGIEYTLDTLGKYDKESASYWEVTFVDGTSKRINAGDIYSVIAQFNNYEEIVKFECLPE